MNWPREPLPERDLAIMRAIKWRAFKFETAVAVAEGWNAGVETADMAKALGIGPASVRMLLGALTQREVGLRKASHHLPPVAISTPAPRPPPKVDPEHLRRLRRLAAFDSAACGALERLQARGVA